MGWILGCLKWTVIGGSWLAGLLVVDNGLPLEELIYETSANGVVYRNIIGMGVWRLVGGLCLMEVGYWTFFFSTPKALRGIYGVALVYSGFLTHLITLPTALYLGLVLFHVLV